MCTSEVLYSHYGSIPLEIVCNRPLDCESSRQIPGVVYHYFSDHSRGREDAWRLPNMIYRDFQKKAHIFAKSCIFGSQLPDRSHVAYSGGVLGAPQENCVTSHSSLISLRCTSAPTQHRNISICAPSELVGHCYVDDRDMAEAKQWDRRRPVYFLGFSAWPGTARVPLRRA